MLISIIKQRGMLQHVNIIMRRLINHFGEYGYNRDGKKEEADRDWYAV